MPQEQSPLGAADRFALIGAGPMGLAAAKVMTEQGISFQGFELHSDVGGLWDIDAPRSTMSPCERMWRNTHPTQR